MKINTLKIQYYNDHHSDNGSTYCVIFYAKEKKDLEKIVIKEINGEIPGNEYRMKDIFEEYEEFTDFIDANNGYKLKENAPEELIAKVHGIVTKGTFATNTWTYQYGTFEIIGDCEDFIINGVSQNSMLCDDDDDEE